MSTTTGEQYNTAQDLCLTYVATRDHDIRDQIVHELQWLVTICAKRLLRRGESLEDLIQVANVGLLQALERYDPTFDTTFRTYASTFIDGVLRRHYRSVWRVHVPRRLQELNQQVSVTTDRLRSELERSPTAADVSEYLGVPVTEVQEAQLVGHSYWPSDSLVTDGSEYGVEADADRQLQHLEDAEYVHTLLRQLSDRSRTVLYMRYFEEMSQSEIGSKLGMSQTHVSRIIRQSLGQLREMRGAA